MALLSNWFFRLSGALQITDSVEEDQGKYECVAENPVGTEYSHFTMLYVKGMKNINSGPEPVPGKTLRPGKI